MYQFAAAQQTSTAKSPTFFQSFQVEVYVLRVNKIKVNIEHAFTEIILIPMVSKNQLTPRKFCFGDFCRSATGALILRPRKTNIYVFRRFFECFDVEGTSCSLRKRLLASKCTILLLCSKHSTEKLPTFSRRFQLKMCALSVDEIKITTKNTFNRYSFEIEGNHESSNDKKDLF